MAQACARRACVAPWGNTGPAGRPDGGPQWGPRERLAALGASHELTGEALSAWCRSQGLFEHQLTAWREAFCAPNVAGSGTATGIDAAQSAQLKALTVKHASVVKELARKARALAEAAALLVLQKKFQALWEDAA